nr:ATP-binding cassette domain-containing protein [Balneicella halophila]
MRFREIYIIKCNCGFIPDYEGKIITKDTPLSTDTATKIRKNIAWLPQDTSLNLETAEELFYAPFKFEVNKKQKPTKEEVSDILKEFELTEELLSKKVNEISVGQKQRIILASCLLLKKPLLLIDEPTSALDTAIKKKVTDYILSQDELTILAVTHNNYWMDKSDHIVEIK